MSRGVVVEAYAAARRRGLPGRSRGRASRGSRDRPRGRRAVAASGAAAGARRSTSRPCRADVSQFPARAWLRSVRRVLRSAPDEQLAFVGGRGVPALRDALAAYLNRVRGTSAPRRTTSSSATATPRASRWSIDVLVTSGARRLAVEDPCADDDAVPVARAAGPRGRRRARRRRRASASTRSTASSADALVLTPSHQWPIGAVLSPERARRCCAGRRQRRADHRGRLRRRVPLRPRADRGHAGPRARPRASMPAPRARPWRPGSGSAGSCRRPASLRRFAAAKALADRGSPVLDQLAFADFLARGEFDRHLRRMRPLYRRRRDALLAALAQQLPELEPVGIAAGLHLRRSSAAGRRRGRGRGRRGPSRPGGRWPGALSHRRRGRPGLVIGYAALSERAIADGVRRLAEAIDASDSANSPSSSVNHSASSSPQAA